MTNTIQTHIAKLVNGEDLTRIEAENAFQIIMNGGATPAQMAAFLTALRMKGESVSELTAGAKVLRMKAVPFHAPDGVVDTCGTGGDARGTLNISTAVAIVVAACGVPVAKHGNRSVSSKSGSSDVLTALGVNVDASVEIMERAIRECNLAFLMAPRFHTAMRHVAPVRQELGMRTIFNLLGPLSNPAQPKFQIVGVYDRHWLEPMARVLAELGCERAWVVHGSDGLDELTTAGESFICELNQGTITHWELTPEELGLERATLKQLEGRDAKFNAAALNDLVRGQVGPYRDIVLLNAAAVLVVAGKAADLAQGMMLAADALESGKARDVLSQLILITSYPQ